MQRQLKSMIAAALAALARALVTGLRAAWSVARPLLVSVLNVTAALILLFEEWGWRPLAAALGWLARFRLVRRLELWIAGLPPYGALIAFALPATLLFPLKLVALWLLANGLVVAAGALFVGAKIASTALVARLFMLTKPALMQIGWFARAYNWLMPWKEALFATIRASRVWRYGRVVKARLLRSAQALYGRMKPRIEVWARKLIAEVRAQARSIGDKASLIAERLRQRLG